MEASSSSSSSDDDDDFPLVSLKRQQSHEHSKAFSSSSDDDYAPIRPPKSKKLRRAPKNTDARHIDDGAWMESPEAVGEDGRPRRSERRCLQLKPLFEVGAAVTAAWWPDRASQRSNRRSSWFPGVVRSYRRHPRAAGPYGPIRLYDIEYCDGDELDGVADHFLVSREDYELSMQHEDREWIGVRNVTDDSTGDKWAEIVGWYVATIDGEDRPFSLLADALDAYDASVIAKRKKKDIEPSDLNRPEKYSWLFQPHQKSISEDKSGEAERPKNKTKKKIKKSPANETSRTTDFASNTSAAASASSLESRKLKSVPNAQQKTSAISAYIGVSYSKKHRKYLAQKQSKDGKVYCLGYYKFETDAALAVDKGAMLGAEEECNFTTQKQYENHVRREMKAASRPVNVEGRHDAVVEKVQVYLSQIYADQNSVEGDSSGTVETSTPFDTGQNDKHFNSEEVISSSGMASKAIEAVPKDSLSTASLAHSKINSERAKFASKKISDTKSKSLGKNSKFIGTTYIKAQSGYAARIYYRKQYQLGTYRLQTDAAMAYDQATKLLRGTDKSRVNFQNRQKYIQARAKELEKSKHRPESLAEVAEKIQNFLFKLPCPELVALNNEISKKWAHSLPSETGEEFLEFYQNNLVQLFKEGSKCVNAHAPGTRSPQLPNHSKLLDNSSDDGMSISYATEKDDEGNSIAVSNTGSIGLNDGNIEQESFKKFPLPIGCPVLWNFNCNSFRRGVVISPPIHGTDGDTAYKVSPTAHSCKPEPSSVITAKELAFGIDCPVHVLHDSRRNTEPHPLEGKVLFCTPASAPANNLQGTLFLYTILIAKEGNQFQVMTDVPSPLVRHRIVKEAPVPGNIGRGRIAASPGAMKDKSQASSHKLFSSNSTITSDEFIRVNGSSPGVRAEFL